MKTVFRSLTALLGSSIVLGASVGIAQAELTTDPASFNVLDTETGLEWRKFEGLADQGAYNDALGKYDAGSTYRLPTAAEVDDLLTKLFPGFVANDATGRCGLTPSGGGGYPGQLEQAQAFINKFGGNPFHAMYENAAGELRALFVELTPYGSSTSKVCLTGRSDTYESFRSSAPSYPTRDLLVMVVREAVDVKVPAVTVFDYIAPEDIGLLVSGYNYGVPSHTDQSWSSLPYITYCCTEWTIFALESSPTNFAAGKSAPWVRLQRFDYTPLPGSGGSCAPNQDLGNGYCRVSFVGNYWPWHLTGQGGQIPGSYLNNRGQIDNLVVEQIWDNISVDFAPASTANAIWPKKPGWSISIAIKTTSIAAGDDYDFDAADIDPATLRVGKNLAEVLDYQSNDIDGDGDIDFVYRFTTGATGATCLDTNITVAGKTYAGAPIAGHDTIAPQGCTETISIDVDPFNAANTIRPNDDYNVTVAIHGLRTAAGDPINLYPGLSAPDGVSNPSLKFGSAETPIVGTPILTDIDGDANQDMLVNFNVYDAGIACGDTEVQLTGSKNSGIPIEAFDTIVTEDCETGCHP